ncbi:uncharacterized protein L203_104870 [Cryptococcus depauperatus CBS 7841]|uniref:Uncharacterized protein n=1 Tax=Cryptococcus depauperatus CBS 7841 TaxID=1295531 RepID=A0AAJ8M2M2_9TREE
MLYLSAAHSDTVLDFHFHSQKGAFPIVSGLQFLIDSGHLVNSRGVVVTPWRKNGDDNKKKMGYWRILKNTVMWDYDRIWITLQETRFQRRERFPKPEPAQVGLVVVLTICNDTSISMSKQQSRMVTLCPLQTLALY